MKFCVNFSKESKILDKVDEINIQYNRIESAEALSQFCEEHKNQRINLCIDNLEEGLYNNWIKDALDYQEQHQDYKIYIRLEGKNEELSVMLMKYPKAKFYFNYYVNTWDMFIGYVNYGVSDIFIIEGLGFELDKIAAIAHSHNIQVRAFPNVAQSSWKELDDLRKFWIRPDDIDAYEQYVDVCEFFGEEKEIKPNILYEIYSKDKTWFGNLKEIIIGLKNDIDSRYIIPRFAKKRIRCGRECLKGGNCKICDNIQELSGNLEKAGLIVTINNNKEEEIDG